MENNIINEAIHIEFYGLPGCGKSTISHKVAEQLRYEGFNIIEPSYDILYGNSKFVRLVKKIIYSIRLLFKNKKIYKNLKELVKKNDYKELEVYKQLANLAYKIYIYNYSQKAIYIWDEGIVQSAISLSTLNEVRPNENYKNILKICGKNSMKLKILIEVEPRLSIKRLKERDNKHARVEFLNDKEKELMLKKIEKCIKDIENVDFSSSKVDDELYKDVLEYTKKRINM